MFLQIPIFNKGFLPCQYLSIKLEEINTIVNIINSITQNSGIPDWTGGVLYLKVTENSIKWVLEKFGRKCPSNYDYPWFNLKKQVILGWEELE